MPPDTQPGQMQTPVYTLATRLKQSQRATTQYLITGVTGNPQHIHNGFSAYDRNRSL